MNVLLITEKLDKNDEVASYFHGRLLDFAEECDTLSVLVLENKAHSLPEKVNVASLGKEKGASRLQILSNFYRYIFANSAKYDRVFVHRNPIYIVLGGLFWRMMGKEVTLWYSHTYSDWMLHVAVFFANQVISPTTESFPFHTNKLRVLGGHDLDAYVCHIKQ
jgi:hypothetical protein